MRRTAVVTTFSKAGFDQYAERMIRTWLANWPSTVALYVYPDEPVPLPDAPNLTAVYDPIEDRDRFKEWGSARAQYRGYQSDRYDYRFDAVKFCHKPFALWDFRNRFGKQFDDLVWLDADTITHAPVPDKALRLIAPSQYDVQFLGRSYKYSEMGYCYWNLKSQAAMDQLDQWVRYYRRKTLVREREWHDSYLWDQARFKIGSRLKGNDLTGHLHRRQGAGHPFVNSFLGQWLDHHKGAARKASGLPRPGDLFTNHTAEYWKHNAHAKARTKKPRSLT